jgi:hypothetical protein
MPNFRSLTRNLTSPQFKARVKAIFALFSPMYFFNAPAPTPNRLFGYPKPAAGWYTILNSLLITVVIFLIKYPALKLYRVSIIEYDF